MIFYDVQLQDAANALAMPANADLNLAINRLKSLQKLYLFEQKGGENYLGWTDKGLATWVPIFLWNEQERIPIESTPATVLFLLKAAFPMHGHKNS